MYAVTDGLSGLDATWDTPGSGHNFLVHNMCRLPGADGTWMVVRGGMGTVTSTIADLARQAGATIVTGTPVVKIEVSDAAVRGVVLEGDRVITAATVVVATDPFRLRQLAGTEHLPAAINDKLDSWKHYGTTMKVNLALTDLPTFTCLPERRGQHGATIHLFGGDKRLSIGQQRQPSHLPGMSKKCGGFAWSVEWPELDRACPEASHERLGIG